MLIFRSAVRDFNGVAYHTGVNVGPEVVGDILDKSDSTSKRATKVKR